MKIKENSEREKTDNSPERIRSAIGFTAMEDTANLNGVGRGADEKEPVVADAEPEFFSSLECLNVIFDPGATGVHDAYSDPNMPGANNYIFVPAGPPTNSVDARIFFDMYTGNMNTGRIPSETLGWSVAHEFGHLLHMFDSNIRGLHLNPFRPSDDIMNETGLTISQYDINSVVGRGCGCK